MTLPLTAPTILLVTLISVIGSLLAFDQFYIMTAGQPFNQTATAVFYVYLNSFPYLKLGLRGGAVADHRGRRAAVHGRPAHLHPPEPAMSSESIGAPRPAAASAAGWPGSGRVATKYLAAAICIVVCTVMVLPLVLAILASLKTTGEAAAHAADLPAAAR